MTNSRFDTTVWWISLRSFFCTIAVNKCINIITGRKRSLLQGNIFRSVCKSFYPQVGPAWLGEVGMTGGACVVVVVAGLCVADGGHVWQGACMAAGGIHAIHAGGIHARGHAWQWDVCRKDGYWSGWCASYWNAFLFTFICKRQDKNTNNCLL